MPIIVWQESYSVGVAMLDKHHQHLLKLINQLAEHSACSVHSEQIVDSISELTQYAMYHFACEERLMVEHGFPRLTEHQNEHLQFCEVIAETSYGATLGVISTENLLDYLTKWLKNHILHEDMQFKTFFAAKGVN